MNSNNSSGSSVILLILILIIIGAGFLGSHYYHLSQSYDQLMKEKQAEVDTRKAAVQQAADAFAQRDAAEARVHLLENQVANLTEQLNAAKAEEEQLRSENESYRSQLGYHGEPPKQNQTVSSPAVFGIPVAGGKPSMSSLLPADLNVITVLGAMALLGVIVVMGSFLAIRSRTKGNTIRRQKNVTLELTPEQMQEYISYRRKSSNTGRTQPVRIN
jgi:hypothetical protein